MSSDPQRGPAADVDAEQEVDFGRYWRCLLYTSDAADESSRGGGGGGGGGVGVGGGGGGGGGGGPDAAITEWHRPGRDPVW